MRSIRLTILLTVICLGCGSVKAPQGAVPTRVLLETDAYGGWIGVTGPNGEMTQGELIALTTDSVFVLDKNELHVIALGDVTAARLIMFKTAEGGYAVWTFLGSILTLTNGGFATFTLPATIISGVSTTFNEARRINYIDYPASSWAMIGKYARFPQGLPSNVDRTILKLRSGPANRKGY